MRTLRARPVAKGLTTVTREEWLNTLKDRLGVALFEPKGHPLPANLRISVGWPSKGGTAIAKRVVGQCWYSDASDDQAFEIFISPTIGDGVRAGDVLVHELCHALLPKGTKHNRTFSKLAGKMGLKGKPTATVAGDELRALLEGLTAEVGAYPHAELHPMIETKKQTTRMLKAACPECGYTVRLSRQWLDVRVPMCPVHGAEMEYDAPEIEPGEGEEREAA